LHHHDAGVVATPAEVTVQHRRHHGRIMLQQAARCADIEMLTYAIGV
jgi:hypothetical protein